MKHGLLYLSDLWSIWKHFEYKYVRIGLECKVRWKKREVHKSGDEADEVCLYVFHTIWFALNRVEWLVMYHRLYWIRLPLSRLKIYRTLPRRWSATRVFADKYWVRIDEKWGKVTGSSMVFQVWLSHYYTRSALLKQERMIALRKNSVISKVLKVMNHTHVSCTIG